jgi:hypothetical protein
MKTNTVPSEVIRAISDLYAAACASKPDGESWAGFAGGLQGDMIGAVCTLSAFLEVPMPTVSK